MESKTKGAWIVHNSNKLANFTTQDGFESTYESGRAGILLSAISRDDEVDISNEKINVLASANGINRLEANALIQRLSDRRLLKIGISGITVLGVASSSALEHTHSLFISGEPNKSELAAIEISEMITKSPLKTDDFSEEIKDVHEMSSQEFETMVVRMERYGVIDFEEGRTEKYYFNGNLFRNEDVSKAYRLITSLSASEKTLVGEIDEKLLSFGCIEESEARKIAGDALMNKLNSISYYDLNIVRNAEGEFGYITKPSSFKKFGSSAFTDDAFDNAKALISSLAYGMQKSRHSRGRIKLLDALLAKLIRGEWLNPVPAIGYDYRALEIRGVVEVKPQRNNYGDAFTMRLLKKEVGEIALRILAGRDVTEMSLENFPETSIINYTSPEETRVKQRQILKREGSVILDMLGVLRD